MRFTNETTTTASLLADSRSARKPAGRFARQHPRTTSLISSRVESARKRGTLPKSHSSPVGVAITSMMDMEAVRCRYERRMIEHGLHGSASWKTAKSCRAHDGIPTSILTTGVLREAALHRNRPAPVVRARAPLPQVRTRRRYALSRASAPSRDSERAGASWLRLPATPSHRARNGPGASAKRLG